jgi:hypothetical protein
VDEYRDEEERRWIVVPCDQSERALLAFVDDYYYYDFCLSSFDDYDGLVCAEERARRDLRPQIY